MKTHLIVKPEDWKRLLESFDAVIAPAIDTNKNHFWGKNGELLEYHLPDIREVYKRKTGSDYVLPFGATFDSINYFFDV